VKSGKNEQKDIPVNQQLKIIEGDYE